MGKLSTVPAALTVATWNLHGGRDEDGRPFRFADRLARLGADLVGLQELELDGGFEATGLPKESGFEYAIAKAFSDSPFSREGGLAVGLLSAAPFVRTETVTLPNPVRTLNISPTFHDKGLLVAEIVRAGVTIDVIALHLFPFHRVSLDARDPALRSLWEEIDERLRPRPGVPRIVLGDFNTPHRFDLLTCLQRGELQSLFLDASTRDNGLAHDDILVSAQWQAQQCQNVPTESDHNLLLATVALREEGRDV